MKLGSLLQEQENKWDPLQSPGSDQSITRVLSDMPIHKTAWAQINWNVYTVDLLALGADRLLATGKFMTLTLS